MPLRKQNNGNGLQQNAFFLFPFEAPEDKPGASNKDEVVNVLQMRCRSATENPPVDFCFQRIFLGYLKERAAYFCGRSLPANFENLLEIALRRGNPCLALLKARVGTIRPITRSAINVLGQEAGMAGPAEERQSWQRQGPRILAIKAAHQYCHCFEITLEPKIGKSKFLVSSP